MKKLKGKLSRAQLDDLDSLLLEMKALNKDQLQKGRAIALDKIVTLDKDKNERFWAYIRHYAKLVVMFPNNLKTIRSIVQHDDTTSMDCLIDDATMEVALWVYRFVWRQYEHSDECGYVFTTANYGFMAWSTAHRNWSFGKDSFKPSVEESEEHNEASADDTPADEIKTETRFSELDFPLNIDDLESALTNP